jgi:hypothetical protein
MRKYRVLQNKNSQENVNFTVHEYMISDAQGNQSQILKYSFCVPLDSTPGAAAPLVLVYFILRGKMCNVVLPLGSIKRVKCPVH